MANISQIEVNGTTYDLVDVIARDSYGELADYYLCGDNTTVSVANYSPNHARFLLNKSVGIITSANHPNPGPVYGLFMWRDTGNLRSDKYDISTSTTTARGYVPVAGLATTDVCVGTSSSPSLIQKNTGWTINSCHIAQWGQVCEMYMAAQYNAAISIPASGNITDMTIGTVVNSNFYPCWVSGLRSNADSDAGAAWGELSTAGEIKLASFDGTGTARSLAANTPVHLGGLWISNYTNNF